MTIPLSNNSMQFIRDQATGPWGIMEMMKQAPMMNPYLAGAQGFLSGMSGLADTQQKKDSRWASGQIRDLYDQMRWNPQQFQGHDIGKQTGLFNQGINWEQIMGNASQGSGINSLESQAMFGGQKARMNANNIADMMRQNVGMQFQDKWNRNNMMTRLAGMMR